MRRVVITGLGIVSPVGCGVDHAWSNLVAGKSGARRIEEFDVSDLSCQIANFVPRGATAEGKFNPDDWMEPKEQRKVDDFIIYAMSAAAQALNDAGWKPTSHDEQRLSYPSDIASRSNVPVVIISHGNGQQYVWYDYMHDLFASHGWVVRWLGVAAERPTFHPSPAEVAELVELPVENLIDPMSRRMRASSNDTMRARVCALSVSTFTCPPA